MAIIRAQVVFQGLTFKPEDVYVNTYHFLTAGTTTAEVDAVQAQLVELYNTVAPAANSRALGSDMSNTISRGATATITKVYLIAPGVPVSPVTQPNPPIKEYRWKLADSLGASSLELPPEMAICASFYAGQNRPRYRGRVYLGPWQIGTSDIPTTEQSIPSVVRRTSIASTFERMITKPDSGPRLAVYSRKDGVARMVTAGWVDDAWDVQRRRGHEATTRTVFPNPI